MAIAFVRNIIPWANASPSTSASFTPTAGDQTILVAQGSGSSIASFSGTGTYSMLTPPGSFLDLNFDPWATAVNLSATAGAQTATVTAGSVGDGVWGLGIEYSGVASITASEVTHAAPGTGANAISGTAVSVPTGSTLLAFCANTSQDAATITTSGTNRGNTQGGFSGGFCWAEYAGAGASITPQFTTSVGADNYVVIQWVLTPSGGSGAALAGTPTATTTGSGNLDLITAAATASTTASAALTTAIKAVAAATAATTGSGTLTAWSTVTLAAPLYTGPGSIVNGEGVWSNGAPGVGATISYDGTNMTINTDGAIVATEIGFSAVCQWNNGGTWSELTVIITPGLTAYPTIDTALTASLTTAIRLAGAAVALTSVSASLSTSIALASTATAVTTAVAALTTQILAAASANASTVATGSLTTQIRLAGAAATLTSLLGNLLTAIELAGAAGDVSTAGGSLTTGSGGAISASAIEVSTLAGSLTTRIQLLGAAIAAATLVADLSTHVRLAATAIGASSGSATLTSASIALNAAAADISAANGALRTVIEAAANIQTLTAAIGVLDQAALTFAAAARVESTAAGPVITGIDVQGAAVDDTDAASALTAAGSDVVYFDRLFRVGRGDESGICDRTPLFFAEQLAGDALRYAIDWTQWLTAYWQAGIAVAIGDRVRARHRREVQFRCVAPGLTGSSEPRWPYGAGAQIIDGNGVIWQAEPIDDFSLAATLEPDSVTWAVLSPLILLKPQVFDKRMTLITIDTSNVAPGVDIDAACIVQSTDGRQKIAKIRLKVR